VIATTLSLSISWTIILFNKFVIGKVYHLIVDMEKVSNKTAFNISFAYKQSIALFINTALISLVIDFFITGNIIGPGGIAFIYGRIHLQRDQRISAECVHSSHSVVRRSLESEDGLPEEQGNEELQELCAHSTVGQ
jgi:hypothetical protein